MLICLAAVVIYTTLLLAPALTPTRFHVSWATDTALSWVVNLRGYRVNYVNWLYGNVYYNLG